MTTDIFNKTPLYDLNSWSDLYYYNDGIYRLFTAERKLIENSEKYISKSRINLKERIDNDPELTYKPKNWQEDSFQSQYYQHYYSDSQNVLNQIVQNHRKSSVLSIFSLIEGQLKLITKLIQSEFEFDVKIKHLNGRDYLDKYWIYLTKVFGMKTENLSDKFNLIKRQRFIRNKIAHSNSEIIKDDLKHLNQFKDIKVYEIGDEYLFEIENADFIFELLKTSQEFFEKLSLEINSRYKEIKNVG
jgi:hypothetical protein